MRRGGEDASDEADEVRDIREEDQEDDDIKERLWPALDMVAALVSIRTAPDHPGQTNSIPVSSIKYRRPPCPIALSLGRMTFTKSRAE